MSFVKMPAFALEIHSLDSLAMLMNWLALHSERGIGVHVDMEEYRGLRGALEWLAARGLVEITNPTTLVKPSKGLDGRLLNQPSIVSFDVAITDRGRGLYNLLPVVK